MKKTLALMFALSLAALLVYVAPAAAKGGGDTTTCNNGINDSSPDGTKADGGEACEDYNLNNNDDCLSDCRLARCGDGITHSESSDTDPTNDEPDLENWKDKNIEPLEDCDVDYNHDGVADDWPDCDSDCTFPVCGDGHWNPIAGEECDPAGSAEIIDGALCDLVDCMADCTCDGVTPECGDGVLDAGEECDDGNTDTGDGCDDLCMLEPTVCGDNIVNYDEECDDGNNQSGDGCSSDCMFEGPATCGDGVLDAGEECDDGNTIDKDLCGNDCTSNGGTVCGDGVQELPEQCDDGNQTDGDGCDHNCQQEFDADGNLIGGGTTTGGTTTGGGSDTTSDTGNGSCTLVPLAASGSPMGLAVLASVFGVLGTGTTISRRRKRQ